MNGNGHPRDDHNHVAVARVARAAHSGQPVVVAPPGPDPAPDGFAEPWRDTRRPHGERVADLLGRMSLEEKVAQLASAWVGAGDAGKDGEVAPFQHELVGEIDWPALVTRGLGQLTRPFGTAPVEPAEGAARLARLQADIVAAGRFGIPALVHDECLAGFTAWRATVFPVPLAWGASFDPALVERMAAEIGAVMRTVGVHQGLAPVLDVTRDPRWGRTEETIGEDPYLVATVGTAYVRGLQSTGVVATLKHFVGYSGSRAGRNQAPVAVGPRELADVLLPPFEMAVREGGARSVMHSYAEIDGVPVAADRRLLSDLLRTAWGFTGTVVADYFGISFLELLHGVAGNPAEAAARALTAGVDVELPSVRCYGEPLLSAVRDGTVPESLVDRAATRVLVQKCELGLLDPGWEPASRATGPAGATGPVDFDPASSRELARDLAEESVVLLANDGTLPLPAQARIAVVGPLADDPAGMLGCYSFPSHVGSQYPDVPIGIDIPTLLSALRTELPGVRLTHVAGASVDGADRSGFAAAADAAGAADVCVAVLGDRAGLFGRGTSGEGCDAEDLRLPGVQAALLDALVASGTPVVLVLLSGRPYALCDAADRLAASVQAFFPGEEGGAAVAGVLSGRVCPSGRLPVSVPRRPGGQPATYLTPPLGQRSDVSSLDPTARYPFGHGLSYTDFDWTDVRVNGQPPDERPAVCGTDDTVTVSLTVRNTGTRAGTDIVQLYLHDPVAQVTRPVNRLIGYARVPVEPGAARRVSFGVHADLASFTGLAGQRVVEPGDIELRLAASSVDIRHAVRVRLVGPERVVDHRRHLSCQTAVSAA